MRLCELVAVPEDLAVFRGLVGVGRSGVCVLGVEVAPQRVSLLFEVSHHGVLVDAVELLDLVLVFVQLAFVLLDAVVHVFHGDAFEHVVGLVVLDRLEYLVVLLDVWVS